MVAQFCHTYPGVYLNPAWDTADRIVPWKFFWLLYGQIRRIHALDRLNLTRATTHGVGLVWGSDKDVLLRSIRTDIDEAGLQ